MPHRPLRTLAYVCLAIILCVVTMQWLGSGRAPLGNELKRLDIQSLTQSVRAGEVVRATWQGNTLEGDLKDGTKFLVNVPQLSWASSVPTQEMLRSGNVKLEFANPPITGALLQILTMIAFPLLVVAAFYFLMLRPSQRNVRGPEDQSRVASLEQALGQAHMEIQVLREALIAKTTEGLSS